ncbi:MAG: hypothetical protein AB1505_20300, partial [Candidatus Latescibacterota bacterium]
MARISAMDHKDMVALQDSIAGEVAGCASLEDAAQRYICVLYDQFCESIVLARLFATVPYGQLPPANRQFVSGLAESAGIGAQIRPETLVLS